MGCVHLVVDLRDEMSATTTLESITKTAKRYPDPDNDKTDAESMQQWKANLMPDKVLHGTKISKFLDPLRVETGRPRKLSWASKHETHEFAKDDGARSGLQVHAKRLQDHKCEAGRHAKYTTTGGGKALDGDCPSAC